MCLTPKVIFHKVFTVGTNVIYLQFRKCHRKGCVNIAVNLNSYRTIHFISNEAKREKKSSFIWLDNSCHEILIFFVIWKNIFYTEFQNYLWLMCLLDFSHFLNRFFIFFLWFFLFFRLFTFCYFIRFFYIFSFFWILRIFSFFYILFFRLPIDANSKYSRSNSSPFSFP